MADFDFSTITQQVNISQPTDAGEIRMVYLNTQQIVKQSGILLLLCIYVRKGSPPLPPPRLLCSPLNFKSQSMPSSKKTGGKAILNHLKVLLKENIEFLVQGTTLLD